MMTPKQARSKLEQITGWYFLADRGRMAYSAEITITIRKSLGMSQREFAKAIGDSASNVCAVETGKRVPGAAWLLKVLNVQGPS